MDSTGDSKPYVCFKFEVEKIINMSIDGSYQVQWRPAWVSQFHLVGCEHLIQQFLLEQQSAMEIKPEPVIQPHESQSPLINENNSSGVNEFPHISSSLEIKVEPVLDSKLPFEDIETKNSEHSTEDFAEKTSARVVNQHNSCPSNQLHHESNASYEHSQVLELPKQEKEVEGSGSSSSPCRKTSTSISGNSDVNSSQNGRPAYSLETNTLGLEQDQVGAEEQEQLLQQDISLERRRHELWTTVVKEITNGCFNEANGLGIDIHTMKNVAHTCQIICREKIQENDKSGENNSSKHFTEVVLEEFQPSRKEFNLHNNEPKSGSEKQINEKQAHTCRICHKSFYFLETFKAHMKTHCSFEFLSPQCPEKSLASHLKLHMRENNKWVCFWCDFSCFLEKDLATHLGQHTFVCDTCNKSFASKNKHKQHLHTHYRPEKRFKCSVCTKSYTSKVTLNRHLPLHHRPEKRFKCTMCRKSFLSKSDLNSHLPVHHQPEKLFDCNFCGKSYGTQKGLTMHTCVHAAKQERLFACILCGSTFTDQFSWVKHSQTHKAV